MTKLLEQLIKEMDKVKTEHPTISSSDILRLIEIKTMKEILSCLRAMRFK